MPRDFEARPAGLEPTTLGLEGRCSIQLSYGRLKSTRILSTGFAELRCTRIDFGPANQPHDEERAKL